MAREERRLHGTNKTPGPEAKRNERLESYLLWSIAMRKKAKVRSVSDVNKKAPMISALMRRLKHVKSSGPYTRDEMNER